MREMKMQKAQLEVLKLKDKNCTDKVPKETGQTAEKIGVYPQSYSSETASRTDHVSQ